MNLRVVFLLCLAAFLGFGACLGGQESMGEPRDAESETASNPVDVSSKPDAGAVCRHVPVAAQCANGWCAIPAGCFWSGSPPEEWGRAQTREPLVPITLTRAFSIQQTETTQLQWTSAGFRNPTGEHPTIGLVACHESDCPVTGISYAEALAFANAKSVEAGLPTCYDLSQCTGKVGQDFECSSFKLRDSVSYACRGYRLPMGAEREYATRAGTRSAFYSGEITRYPENGTCFPDSNLERIAWFCHNSGGRLQPVARKAPNDWGLYDMLGNAIEYIIDPARDSGYGEFPVTDPGDPVHEDYPTRAARGGLAHLWSTTLRSASWLGDATLNAKDEGGTVRLVRTLSAAELDGGVMPRDAAE